MIDIIAKRKNLIVLALLTVSVTFIMPFTGTHATATAPDRFSSSNESEWVERCVEYQAVIPNKGMDQQNSLDVKRGIWGGRGISLVVEKNSYVIDLDCGKAAILTRLRIRKDGKFSAIGIMTRSGPGPVMRDAPPRAQRVRFEGRVSGKQMTIKVTLADSGDLVGDYTLERGAQSELTRCY